MKINLGYCCMTILHEKLRCNRSSTKTYLEQHTPQECHSYLVKKSVENLKDLEQILIENKKIDVLAYRIPEQILPQIDLGYYQIQDLKQELKHAGALANELGIQLSTHPSQYFVLNSRNPQVVQRCITCINLFADIFSEMDLVQTPTITLHVGMKKAYDSTDKAIEAFCENYNLLNQNAKDYLVVENDHVSFTVEDCMKIYDRVGIPVVFDNMHYKWNPGSYSFAESVKQAVSTWGIRTPKVHLSSDREITKHAHRDYILLEDYMELLQALEKTAIEACHVMLECKQKDLAILQLREEWKYAIYHRKENPTVNSKE